MKIHSKWRFIQFKINFKNFLMVPAILLVLIFLVVVGTQSYSSAMKYILQNVEGTNISNLIQINRMLENKLLQIRNITENMATDEILIDSINSFKSKSDLDSYNAINEIGQILTKTRQFNSYISEIILFTDKHTYTSGSNIAFYNITSKDVKQTFLYEYVKNNEPGKASLYDGNFNQSKDTKNNDARFSYLAESSSFICLVKESNAIIFTVINLNIFDTLFKENQNLLIVDKNANVVWKGDKITPFDTDFIQKETLSKKENDIYKINNNSMNAYSIDSAFNNWKLVYIQKNADISSNTKVLRNFFLIVFLSTVILAYFFSEVASRKLSKPIKRFVKSVNSYRTNDKNVHADISIDFPRLTIREGILFYLVLLIITPVITYLIASYIFSCKIIEEHVMESKLNALRQTVENIDYYLMNKEKVANNIICSSSVQYKLSPKTQQKPATNYLSDINRNIILGQDKDEIYIYQEDKSLVFSDSRLSQNFSYDDDILTSFEKSQKHLLWQDIYKDIYARPMINLLVQINSLDDYSRIGYLRLGILEMYLENIYKSITDEEVSVFMINMDNIIISHPDKNKIGTEFEFTPTRKVNNVLEYGKDSFIYKLKLQSNSWYLVGQYKNLFIKRDQGNLLIEKIYILVIIFFVTVLLVSFFAFNVASSINKMNQLLERIGLDNVGLTFPENSPVYELKELNRTFNSMVFRIESLIDQLLISSRIQNELENKKKEAEMIALQSQINPHFLSNSFESIKALVKRGNDQSAVNMINSLSSLLRYSAESSNPIVQIEEELNHTKYYADIMKIRFAKNLSFHWSIDENLRTCKIVRLTLQPIIENAIYHGINPKSETGSILFDCRQDGDEILLSISDNGAGMDEATLKDLVENLNKEDYRNSIGLFNVQNRIKLFFGKQYGLTIKSKLNEGTTVEIRIPKLDIKTSEGYKDQSTSNTHIDH